MPSLHGRTHQLFVTKDGNLPDVVIVRNVLSALLRKSGRVACA